MFLQTMKSEWSKLWSTSSIYWTTGIYLVLCVGFSSLTALLVRMDPKAVMQFSVDSLLALVGQAGYLVLAIQAVLVVSNEYGNRYQSATFLATPNRPLVALAKWLIYALLAALLTFVTVLLCLYLAKFIVGGPIGQSLDVWGDERSQRFMWLYPFQAIVYVTVGQALGWLTRSTAGSIAIVLLTSMIEGLLGLLPKIGEHIFYLMPFTNFNAFMSRHDVTHMMTGKTAPWGWEGSLWYFLALLAVLVICSMISLEKRDV
ncbi:ABC transporter permease [Corynebacterium pyruviciproducens]|uniref:ABC transporter permease n=1 Tax=Corynebacterium pyruviciproducens TaxID=598660 RepID=UPI002550C659|nr:ABC transporter permease [Corynebacterium pyruviciproducens]MDK7214726.1 ABC transporter permease [Corynebacterium pyruviciproducens]